MGSNNDQNFRGGHFSHFLKMPVLGITTDTAPPQITGSIALDLQSQIPYYSIQTEWVPFCSCNNSFGQFSNFNTQEITSLGEVVSVNTINSAVPSADYTLSDGGIILTNPGWYQVYYSVSNANPGEFVLELNGQIQTQTDYASTFPVSGVSQVEAPDAAMLLQLTFQGPNVPITIENTTGDAAPVQIVINKLMSL
jgi:hypothetical protein